MAQNWTRTMRRLEMSQAGSIKTLNIVSAFDEVMKILRNVDPRVRNRNVLHGTTEVRILDGCVQETHVRKRNGERG